MVATSCTEGDQMRLASDWRGVIHSVQQETCDAKALFSVQHKVNARSHLPFCIPKTKSPTAEEPFASGNVNARRRGANAQAQKRDKSVHSRHKKKDNQIRSTMAPREWGGSYNGALWHLSRGR